MKKFNLIGLVAIVLGIGAAFAFTKPAEQNNALLSESFEYIGPQFPTELEAKDPDNYQPLTSECPEGITELCSIMAEPSSSDPDKPVIQGDQPLETALEEYVSSNGSDVDPDYIQEKD